MNIDRLTEACVRAVERTIGPTTGERLRPLFRTALTAEFAPPEGSVECFVYAQAVTEKGRKLLIVNPVDDDSPDDDAESWVREAVADYVPRSEFARVTFSLPPIAPTPVVEGTVME